ncbi:MAG: hypothetical protein HRU19_29635 [Pseudobacteriovorax sp.]|nr:hypothetical protein [Pseudobacteriovorax sp.]
MHCSLKFGTIFMGLLSLSSTSFSKQVKIEVSSMTAETVSDDNFLNDTDEVYFKIKGRFGKITPFGDAVISGDNLRLPKNPNDDDYYRFKDYQRRTNKSPYQWRNQDAAPVDRPVIWSGNLPNNYFADFWVLVGEQDNKDVGQIRSALDKALSEDSDAIANLNPKLKAIHAAAKISARSLANRTKDDTIGLVYIRAENINHQVKFYYVTPGDYQVSSNQGGYTSDGSSQPVKGAGGAISQFFDMDGTGGARYQMTILAKVSPIAEKVKSYLGRTNDKCRRTWLGVVNNRDYRVRLSKQDSEEYNFRSSGFYKEFPVSGSRLKWYCGGDGLSGGSKEWATCNIGTNYIRVRRGYNQTINWYCFKEEPYFSF